MPHQAGVGCPEGWADGVQELDGLLARHLALELELDSSADQLTTANAAAAASAAAASAATQPDRQTIR